MDFGALDDFGTFMYTPKEQTFSLCNMVLASRETTDEFLTSDSEEYEDTESHRGVQIILLKESGPMVQGVPTHFPTAYAAPSIVTVTSEDLQKLAVDIESSAAYKTAAWPGISQASDCPLCRKKTVPDGTTEYVLCIQPGMMIPYEGRESSSNSLASNMLWRIFCLQCFGSLTAGQTLSVMSKRSSEEVVKRCFGLLDLTRQGYGGPFENGNLTVPLHQRTTSIIQCGLHATISADFVEFSTRILASKVKGLSRRISTSSAARKVLVERCSEESCKKTTCSEKGQSKPLMICSKCKSTRYCSRECQLKHWAGGHKSECRQQSVGKTHASTGEGGR